MARLFVIGLMAHIPLVLSPDVDAAQAETSISQASRDEHGVLVHRVQSNMQSATTEIRVLLPRDLARKRRYACLYVLPVEAGKGDRYGNGLLEVMELDLHNQHQLICVAPTFSDLPWYADHPQDPRIRQESYFLQVVVPFIDETYPVREEAAHRLLIGFSKSGWGAFVLVLRHPDVFGRAAAWDAPLVMDRPNRFGMGSIFGSQENFERYRITSLLQRQAGRFREGKRLIHLGYGNFSQHHESLEKTLNTLKISHVYCNGPRRDHLWGSGWLPDAVAFLVRQED